MKKATLILLGMVLCLWSFSPAFGAMDEKNIATLAKWLQAGRGFNYSGSIPSEQRQLLILKLGYGLKYLIDFKTKICYIWDEKPITTIECGIIKKGYPLVAPLITW